ncbi:protein MpNASP [Marchantia polymorpha subsp. ruderalis]
MPAMAIVPDADYKDEEQQEVQEEQALPPLLFDSQRLYDLGCAAISSDSYEEAIDCFSKALEIRVNHYGELAPECASTYYKYGCALLYKVQAESEALCDRNEEPPAHKPSKEEGLSALAGGSKGPVDDDEEFPDEDGDGKSEDDGEDNDGEVDGEEEEGDIELAWKLLETARVIHSKQPARSLDEVDVITALADISLEKENFKTCYADYEQALQILQDLVEPDSRVIASTWYKMALAKQFDNRPQEALEACVKAVSICELRCQRLYKEQELLKAEQGGSNGKMDDGEKMISSEEAVENVGETVVGEDLKVAVEDLKFAKVDAEIKEIEESLVDLREKVEELKQMVLAPSLLEALKAENPEAATMMSEAVSAVFKRISRVEGTSSMGETVAAFPGSSSSEPVTHLGIVGRGIKRATPIPIVEEKLLPPDVQPAKRSAEDILTGGGSGETQIGFGGAS